MKEAILRLMFFMIVWTIGCLIATNLFSKEIDCSWIMLWGFIVVMLADGLNPFARKKVIKEDTNEDTEVL